MAVRGTSKALSEEHEQWVATKYGGKRSPSSGGADNDQGDVRTTDQLIECKLTGHPGAPSNSTLLKQFEKITQEAYSEGRDPLMALRFFSPESPLANAQGWVDLVVREVGADLCLVEDAWRYRELS